MAERIVSPGVFTNEKDQSFLQRGVSEIGASIIGTTIKGPAQIPTKVNSYSEFEEIFGSYTEDSYVPNTVQEYLKNAGVCTVTRLLYEDGYQLKDGVIAIIAESGSVQRVTHVLHPTNPVKTEGGDDSLFEKSKLVSNESGSFVLDVSGSWSNDLSVPGFSGAYTAEKNISSSINSDANNYITKIFGTNPKSVNYPVYVQYENKSAVGLFNQLGEVRTRIAVIDYKNQQDFQPASTPFITSQKIGSNTVNLMKFHTLSHGMVENYDVKIGIRDIKVASEVSDPNGYGTFTVEVRRVNSVNLPNSPFDSDDTDKSPEILESFTNCNLDPDSPNYVVRKIGDQFTTIDSEGKIRDNGEYPNLSAYVRVEVPLGVSKKTNDKLLVPFGFKAMLSPIPDGSESTGDVKSGITLSTFTGGSGGTAGTYSVTPTTDSADGTGLQLEVTRNNSAGKLKAGENILGISALSGGSTLGNVTGPFTVAQTGAVTGGSQQTGAGATISITGDGAGALAAVAVSAVGANYVKDNVITISSTDLVSAGFTACDQDLTITLAEGNLLVETIEVKTTSLGSDYISGDTLTVDLGDIGTASGDLIVTLQASEVGNEIQGLVATSYAKTQNVAGSFSSKNYFGFDFTNLNNLNYLSPIPTSGSTTGLNSDFYLGDMLQDTGSAFPSVLSPYTGSIEDALDAGTLSSKVSINTRKFMVALQGGFDGAKPNTPKLSGGDILATNTLGFDCSGNQTTGTKAYRKAFAALSNTDFFDINMLVTPGILHSLHPAVTGDARQLVEDRQDTFYVMDVPALTDSITTTINNVTSLDSNYTATYFPWVRIIDPAKNKPIFVPPSVLVPGALSFNDSVSAPWYAPAGLNRGGLTTAINTYEKLTQADRDDLYEARINPIANFPNQGICIWGQKTLQSRPSALDRVNVRRLLITVKKFIASATKFLVFEQNTNATRLRFLSIVNPYLESVRSQQGLSAFRVVMDDTNNTPDLIDQNILYGQIFLQPTRTAEFIVLDFNIQPTGASFPE